MPETRIHTPPDGVEKRRVDPQRIELGIVSHGARALNRFFGPNAPEDFDTTPVTQFTEAFRMRAVMRMLLDSVETHGPIDIPNFVKRRFEAAKTLTPLKEGDKPYPSIESAISSLSDLTQEELADINHMKRPVLQLLPIVNSSRYIENLGIALRARGQKALVDGIDEKVLNRADRRAHTTFNQGIAGWNIAITEGADYPELLKGDDNCKSIGNRMEWFKAAHGDRGIDTLRYAQLQQAKISQDPPSPVDDSHRANDTSSILAGEPVFRGKIVDGMWYRQIQRVMIGYRGIDEIMKNKHFRLSVMRKVRSTEA